MAKVGDRSSRNLDTVERRLGSVVRMALMEATAEFDFAVISGKRTAEEQRILFEKERRYDGPPETPLLERDPDQYTIVGNVVTHRDGVEKKSNHQSGNAVDIVPWKGGRPIWDADAVLKVAHYIVGFAAAKGLRLGGGYQWGWDHGHLEIIE